MVLTAYVLMRCTLGYLGGSPRKSVRACVAVHLWGYMTHRKRGARHCTGALGELAPPDGYSTSTHVGFLSCGPSLRVRLCSDALANTLANTANDTLADALADALANTLANTADDTHAFALGNARA